MHFIAGSFLFPELFRNVTLNLLNDNKKPLLHTPSIYSLYDSALCRIASNCSPNSEIDKQASGGVGGDLPEAILLSCAAGPSGRTFFT